jgi:hypothetical protein
LRLEVKAMDNPGPVVIETRDDDQPPALFVRYPVAAARLLDRLERAVGPIDVRAGAGARATAVSTVPMAVSLPLEGCAEVVVGIEGAARGVILQIHPSGVSAPPSRGVVATAQRVCAAQSGKPTTATVTAGDGVGTALVSIYPVPADP